MRCIRRHVDKVSRQNSYTRCLYIHLPLSLLLALCLSPRRRQTLSTATHSLHSTHPSHRLPHSPPSTMAIAFAKRSPASKPSKKPSNRKSSWVMLSPSTGYTPLPGETTLYQSPPRTTLSLQSLQRPPTYTQHCKSGIIYLTNRRVCLLSPPLYLHPNPANFLSCNR